jgi:hypothetical protein
MSSHALTILLLNTAITISYLAGVYPDHLYLPKMANFSHQPEIVQIQR